MAGDVASALAEKGMERGVCAVCGKELPDKRRYYCEEHKPERATKEAEPEELSSVGGVLKSLNAPAPKLLGKFGSTFDPIIVLVLNTVLLSPIDALPEDMQGPLISELSVTDEDVETLMRPIWRIFLSSGIGKKHGASIIENSDVISSIVVLIDISQKQKKVRNLINALNQPVEANASEQIRNGNAFQPGNTPFSFTA